MPVLLPVASCSVSSSCSRPSRRSRGARSCCVAPPGPLLSRWTDTRYGRTGSRGAAASRGSSSQSGRRLVIAKISWPCGQARAAGRPRTTRRRRPRRGRRRIERPSSSGSTTPPRPPRRAERARRQARAGRVTRRIAHGARPVRAGKEIRPRAEGGRPTLERLRTERFDLLVVGGGTIGSGWRSWLADTGSGWRSSSATTSPRPRRARRRSSSTGGSGIPASAISASSARRSPRCTPSAGSSRRTSSGRSTSCSRSTAAAPTGDADPWRLWSQSPDGAVSERGRMIAPAAASGSCRRFAATPPRGRALPGCPDRRRPPPPRQPGGAADEGGFVVNRAELSASSTVPLRTCATFSAADGRSAGSRGRTPQAHGSTRSGAWMTRPRARRSRSAAAHTRARPQRPLGRRATVPIDRTASPSRFPSGRPCSVRPTRRSRGERAHRADGRGRAADPGGSRARARARGARRGLRALRGRARPLRGRRTPRGCSARRCSRPARSGWSPSPAGS